MNVYYAIGLIIAQRRFNTKQNGGPYKNTHGKTKQYRMYTKEGLTKTHMEREGKHRMYSKFLISQFKMMLLYHLIMVLKFVYGTSKLKLYNITLQIKTGRFLFHQVNIVTDF